MIDRSEAEEHLRVIRSLMEKATVYRAISAPGALIAGTIAIALAGVALADFRLPFLPTWLLALVIAATANLALLWRDAQRRGEVFFSNGMRVALRAMLPGLVGGGAMIFVNGACGSALTASLWVLFYGICLLAASHFAPKAICWLGRAFFTAAIALLIGGRFVFLWWPETNWELVAHAIMGATFGLFHLVYALCTWPAARDD